MQICGAVIFSINPEYNVATCTRGPEVSSSNLLLDCTAAFSTCMTVNYLQPITLQMGNAIKLSPANLSFPNPIVFPAQPRSLIEDYTIVGLCPTTSAYGNADLESLNGIGFFALRHCISTA